MTEQNLSDLLERSAALTQVGPPPLEEMLEHARVVRRRRAATLLGGLAAAVGVVAVVASQTLFATTPSIHLYDDPTATPTVTAPTAPAAGSLLGTWKVAKLVSADGRQLIAPRYDDQVRLTFTRKGEVTGRTGCNDVFGSYEQDDGELVVPSEDLGTTLVGCTDEPPLVERLTAVRRVIGTAKERYLLDGQGALVAELRAIRVPIQPFRAGVSGHDYFLAKDVAAREADRLRAQVVLATVEWRRGRVPDPNYGEPCLSGGLLDVTLIGEFPRTVTTGGGTVRAVVVTVDARSGVACQLGVRTTLPAPRVGTVPLDVD